jgi:hypothetical protein
MNNIELLPRDPLVKLERARQLLAECRTLDEVKHVKDIAEAAKVYARAAHLGHDAQKRAAEISLLAATKAGEILKQLDRNTSSGVPAKLAGTSPYAQALAETNTPQRTAIYWQKLADVPEKLRDDYIQEAKKSPKGEITAAGLLRTAQNEITLKPTGGVDIKPARIDVQFNNHGEKDEFLRLAGRGRRSPHETITVRFENREEMIALAQLVARNDTAPAKSLKVNFASRQDMERIAKVVGQPIDMFTQDITFRETGAGR